MPKSPEERERDRQKMEDAAAHPASRPLFERQLRRSAWCGATIGVEEQLSWKVDPNCQSIVTHRTPLIRAVTGPGPIARIVELLLAAGADPCHTDICCKSALHYARERLADLEGKPRKRRRPRNLTPHGDLILRPSERRQVDRIWEIHANRPDIAQDLEEYYLAYQRQRAERALDIPGNLEKIAILLEHAANA
jgi:hypothetical protein